MDPRERRRIERRARRRMKPVLRKVKRNTKKIKRQTENFADKKSGCAVTALAIGGALVGVATTWRS